MQFDATRKLRMKRMRIREREGTLGFQGNLEGIWREFLVGIITT